MLKTEINSSEWVIINTTVPVNLTLVIVPDFWSAFA